MIGDVELFAREIRPDAGKPGKAPVIAITGTNGKSTTTALIGHILAARGFRRADRRQYRQVGAGIGPAGPKTIYVLEMSSFQIDLTPGLIPISRCSPTSRPIISTAMAAWRIMPRSSSGCCARCPKTARRLWAWMTIWRGDLHRALGRGRSRRLAGVGGQGAGPRRLCGRWRAL